MGKFEIVELPDYTPAAEEEEDRKTGRVLDLSILTLCALLIWVLKCIFNLQAAAFSELAMFGRSGPKGVGNAAWGNFEKMFIFGDSYSDTYFNLNGELPSPNAPMGNPPYLGSEAAGGAKWPVYLTTQYNDSLIQTYNLARSGATVDNEIMPDNRYDFVREVRERFIPAFVAGNEDQSKWNPATALFATFFGINDNTVVLNWDKGRSEAIAEAIAQYGALLEELYALGARNFLVMNLPPMHHSPAGLSFDAIVEWNSRLRGMVSDFRVQWPSATVHEFDTYNLFNTVIENPYTFPETAGYKITRGHCPAYAKSDNQKEAFDEECVLPLREYLWHDALHPTYPMHESMAARIADQLRGGKKAGPKRGICRHHQRQFSGDS